MLAEEREGIAFQHIAEAVADLVFVMSAFTSSQCSTGSAWLAILMAGMAVPIRCESGSKHGSGKYSSQGDDRTLFFAGGCTYSSAIWPNRTGPRGADGLCRWLGGHAIALRPKQIKTLLRSTCSKRAKPYHFIAHARIGPMEPKASFKRLRR